ncbi:DUF6209 family protein [Myxococcus sp. SDU36]|uniref:DUF6209 family protein n=1 Tax=Myxococcus sp. SDU36 TaxID=2831967 RepID=UPI0025430594|nr:DUF6209 family protein [Myxococcus sp. SDU36]WIG95227.1 hypothetical protein KGD87_32800 [Myxococcus sp. SDU36]
MSNRIGRSTFAPPTPTPAASPQERERAGRASARGAPTARAQVDQFEARGGARKATLLTGTSAQAARVEPPPSKAADLQPQVHAATGYAAHFGANGQRSGTAFVEGQGRVTLPPGGGRGPSFHAEAGKPLTVTLDPSRVMKSTEKLELVWRMVPGGTETVVPLSDGTRDPATGKLNPTPATFDLPQDAFGLVRMSIRTTDASGRVSNQWDPSYDAAVAPPEAATIVFSDDWKTTVEGSLRAGDTLKLAYDQDRLAALIGKMPSDVVASVSFNGEPPLDVPLTVTPDAAGKPGAMFMPSLKIPLEATQVSLWFKGQGEGATGWDSSFGKNFTFDIGTARDDADPSWKAEMLRSKSFPNLTEEKFVGIGPSTQRYNCIAWTVGVRDEWVWPGTKVEDFDKLYADKGFKPLDTVDLSHDPDLEKVVIYGLKPRSGTGPLEVTHGALMDDQGRFTSKIGTQPLIRHNSADDLSGPSYGEPVRVYVRPRQSPVNAS